MSAHYPQRHLGGVITTGSIGLGCMGMSWAYDTGNRDDTRSIDVIRRAIELGVTLIDTSDVYGPFTNEVLVGRAITGRRDSVVLATKCGFVATRDQSAGTGWRLHRNGRPEHVRAALHASLRRLGSDWVDLYQLHRTDPRVPIEETWGAMAEHVIAGSARAIGMSQATLEELQRAHAVHPVTSVQSELSLWTRDQLDEVLPWCKVNGVAFIAFAPLGRGFLTGRHGGVVYAPEDLRAHHPRFTDAARAANQAIVDRVSAIAIARDATVGQIALAWVLAQGPQVVPIPGTRHRAYLDENAAAATVSLTRAELDALAVVPPPVGGRRPELAYEGTSTSLPM